MTVPSSSPVPRAGRPPASPTRGATDSSSRRPRGGRRRRRVQVLGGPSGTEEQKSPLAALFDFSFTTFATPGLIKILYIVGTALLLLGWLGFTIVNFANSGAVAGILTFLLGAVVVLFYLAFLRLSLEFYFAVVRMSEDIHHRR